MDVKFSVRVLAAYDDIDTNEIPFSLDQIANATSTQLKAMIEVGTPRITSHSYSAPASAENIFNTRPR